MKNAPRHKARRLTRMSQRLYDLAFNIHFGMHYSEKRNDVNTLIEAAKLIESERNKLIRTQLRFKRN